MSKLPRRITTGTLINQRNGVSFPVTVQEPPRPPKPVEPTEALHLTLKERQALTILLARGVDDTLYNRTAALYKAMLRKLDRISLTPSATAERARQDFPIASNPRMTILPPASPRPAPRASSSKTVFRNVPVDIAAAVRVMDAALRTSPPSKAVALFGGVERATAQAKRMTVSRKRAATKLAKGAKRR